MKIKSLENQYFNDAILKWKNLLEFDFVAEPKYRGGVWSVTSDIWPVSMVESLTHNQLLAVFEIIREQNPEKFLSQITALLSLLQYRYPDQKGLVRRLEETKTIECYNLLQSYIDNCFSKFNNERPELFSPQTKDFCFSQQSDKTIGNMKAENIITNFSFLTDEQAYLIIVSIFGLKYVDRSKIKKLGLLIKTAHRYWDANLKNIPKYELESLLSIL